MGKVTFDMSISLDGFVTASNIRPEEPLGDGGQRLHDWAFNTEDDRNREVLAQGVNTGAIIAGRRTYDASVPWWGADGPSGAARLPLFVVTHNAPRNIPKGSVYRFITNGIESAMEEAQKTAGGKDVTIMGGPEIGQQFIHKGLVDEISIHLVPVLFGGGIRLFERLQEEHILLETIGVIDTPEATHLRYRIVKKK